MADEPEQMLVAAGALKAAFWFFENSLDAFLAVQDGVLKKVNPTWSAVTGWRADEAEGQPYWRFLHPDDLAATRAAFAAMAFGERSVCEHRLRGKSGGWLWMRSHAARGADGWVLVILRDITEERRREKESEEARRTAGMLRTTAGVTIWRYNADEDFYEINPDFTRPADPDPSQRRRTGESVRGAIHPDDIDDVVLAVERTLATGEPALLEYAQRDEDGAWRRLRVAWQGVRQLPSGRWEIVGIAQDVSELTEARDAAMRGEQAARGAAEAKSQFLANMSHEIRTPLNGVLGVLHLLKAEGSAERRAQLVGEALASGANLADLLTDIIDYADIESGKMKLALEAIDPAEQLEMVAGLLRPRALAKGLAFQVECAPQVTAVRADPGRLRQMFLHLIGNAVKFTETGSVRARLSASGEGETQRLRLEVTDTGPGISAQAQASLFEGFTQVDSSATRRFGGPGLGLSITRRLAELMEGHVGVSSRLGAGSTFWVEVVAPACERPQADAADEGGWLSGLRVLVVEDNPTNRLVATTMLSHLGAEVQTAENGAEGVAAVQRSDFDLIFMDIQMPVMDGVEATRRIRAMPAPKGATPIVATTANVMPAQLASYRSSGMNGVVAKPISPTAILAEVARVANDADDTGAPPEERAG